MLSLDTEQIWGYLDLFNEQRFMRLYPDAVGAHAKLLECLTKAGVSATWFLVGGMALSGSQGPRDSRMAGLPMEWTNKIASGVEATDNRYSEQSEDSEDADSQFKSRIYTQRMNSARN